MYDKLDTLSQVQKDKVEFLCNECCSFYCKDRKACYENVSRKNLGENCSEHICTAPDAKYGYGFSKAMKNGLVKKCAVGEYPKSWIGRYQAA